LEVAAADLAIGVLAGYDLALLGDANLAAHGARGLREDGLVRGPAAPAERPAPTVKEAQHEAEALEELGQLDLGLVELPRRREEAAVLVAVGVAEHHFADAAPAPARQRHHLGAGEESLHDVGAATKIVDGLEERDDAHRARGLVARVHQADLAQDQHDLEEIGD